jgi:hypothetical protein
VAAALNRAASARHPGGVSGNGPMRKIGPRRPEPASGGGPLTQWAHPGDVS